MADDKVNQWYAKYYRKHLKRLPPRIRRDIVELPAPKEITKVESCYIHGKPGSGKTIQAVRMMLMDLKFSFVARHSQEHLFIAVPELLLNFKDLYNRNGEDNQTEAELVKYYSDLPLLVLDDFGVEYTTNWSFQLLYIIINRRYEQMKKTIFTSNFSLAELSDKLGDDRIPGRIQQMCKVIKAKNIDYRIKNKLS